MSHILNVTLSFNMAPAKTGGDDLDDGLDLDNSLVAHGGDDEEGSIVGDEEVDINAYMTDEEDKGPRVTGQKRKISQDDDTPAAELDDEAQKAEKKRRRKEKDKERRAKVG